jgi:hypothetical protein
LRRSRIGRSSADSPGSRTYWISSVLIAAYRDTTEIVLIPEKLAIDGDSFSSDELGFFWIAANEDYEENSYIIVIGHSSLGVQSGREPTWGAR